MYKTLMKVKLTFKMQHKCTQWLTMSIMNVSMQYSKTKAKFTETTAELDEFEERNKALLVRKWTK